MGQNATIEVIWGVSFQASTINIINFIEMYIRSFHSLECILNRFILRASSVVFQSLFIGKSGNQFTYWISMLRKSVIIKLLALPRLANPKTGYLNECETNLWPLLQFALIFSCSHPVSERVFPTHISGVQSGLASRPFLLRPCCALIGTHPDVTKVATVIAN